MKEVQDHGNGNNLAVSSKPRIFFHLYFDKNSFFLVPKNAYADSDEIHEMRQLLKAKVGGR